MTAEIIAFAKRGAPPDGNGAREAVHGILEEFIAKYPSPGGYHISIADHVLLLLWERGFKVVPIE